MKTVYYSKWFPVGLVILLGWFVFESLQKHSSIDFKLWISLAALTAAALYIFWHSFSPWMQYDQNGFEILFGYYKAKRRWAAVYRISNYGFLRSGFCDTIYARGFVLPIFRILIKDSDRVVVDIVRYVQKANSDAVIVPEVLKWVEKIERRGQLDRTL